MTPAQMLPAEMLEQLRRLDPAADQPATAPTQLAALSAAITAREAPARVSLRGERSRVRQQAPAQRRDRVVRYRVVLSVAALLVLVVLAGWGISSRLNSTAPLIAAPPPAPAPSSPATPPSPRPSRATLAGGYPAVSDATIAALRARGTSITVVPTHKSPKAALKAAGGTRRPVEVSLARATVDGVTEVSAKDTTSTGRRIIVNRLVWILIYERLSDNNIQANVSGKYAPRPVVVTPPPEGFVIRSFDIIDATTNAYLHGGTPL